MYSIVLLAAMTPGSDVTPAPAPAAPVVAGCCGGTVVYGCYGSCSGCWGGCHGCHGGRSSCHGGGLFGGRKSCHGCSGCHGYSCTGWSCFGSCHGCYGSYWSSGCWGGCHGCHGAYPVYAHPTVVIPVAPMTPPAPAGGAKPEDKGMGKGMGMGANIKFHVPAGAKLFVDGRQTGGEGTERAFFTPPLEAGQKYFYEVKAEVVVAGKTVVEEKKVIVEAGAEVVEMFPVLTAAVEKAGAVASK